MGYKFDGEVVAVVDAQVACTEGCQFFTSGSNGIVCKEKIPKIAILKVRWAAVNTVIWRCDAFVRSRR